MQILKAEAHVANGYAFPEVFWIERLFSVRFNDFYTKSMCMLPGGLYR